MPAAQSPTYKVALCQMQVKPLSPEANFSTAASYVREGAKQGASLAVLPEYHLTGWDPEDPQFAHIAKTAYSYVSKYQELAKELSINIIPGTIVTSDPPGRSGDGINENSSSSIDDEDPAKPVLLNIAPFISYTGEVLGTYTKTNLWVPERNHLTSGPDAALVSRQASVLEPEGLPAPQPHAHARHTHQSEMSHGPPPSHNNIKNDTSNVTPQPHTVIETPLGPVGILICWDLAFPEAFRSLIQKGARTIIIPTFWTTNDMSAQGLALNPEAETLFLKSALVSRAFENTCAIIFCNVGGPQGNDTGYCGLSRVVLPIVGTVKGSFEDGTPGVSVVDVDMGVCDIAEANYKIREDLARSDWHYGYEKARTAR